jgi:hypothetical protein
VSAGVLSSPGSKAGPCVDTCGHRDCAQTRAMAGAICKYCDGPIGYNVRFYEVFRSADGKDRDYAHATCHEAAIERGES